MDVTDHHGFHEFETLLLHHKQTPHVDFLVLNAGVASRGSVLETEVGLDSFFRSTLTNSINLKLNAICRYIDQDFREGHGHKLLRMRVPDQGLPPRDGEEVLPSSLFPAIDIPTYPPTYLPTYLSSYLSSYLPTFLST